MGRVAIISVDGHVKAPREGYRDYIDPKWHGAFDEWLQGFEGMPDGFVRAELGEDAQWDPKRRVADLERQGVMAEVLFGNGAPFAEGRRRLHAPDPSQTRQANMAFNRWVIDFCSEAPGRLHGQALVSFDDVDQAVRRRPLGEGARPRRHPDAAAVPGLEPSSSIPRSTRSGRRARRWACRSASTVVPARRTTSPWVSPRSWSLAAEHSFFSGRSLWQLILGGVFDRFPDLKIAFIETESWWMRADDQGFSTGASRSWERLDRVQPDARTGQAVRCTHRRASTGGPTATRASRRSALRMAAGDLTSTDRDRTGSGSAATTRCSASTTRTPRPSSRR